MMMGFAIIVVFVSIKETKKLHFEAEKLKIVDSKSCTADVQTMEEFQGQWSGGTQLLVSSDRPNASITLEVNISKEGVQKIEICFTKAPDYGLIQLLIDGRRTGSIFDGYAEKVLSHNIVDYGDVYLSEGQHRFTFQIVEKNTNSYGCSMGIDNISFRQKGY